MQYLLVEAKRFEQLCDDVQAIKSVFDNVDVRIKEKPVWASKKAVAERIHVSTMTLNRLMKDGKIVFRKEGRKVLINLQSVEDYYSNK